MASQMETEMTYEMEAVVGGALIIGIGMITNNWLLGVD